MLLSAVNLRAIKPVDPFIERTVINGKSAGVSVAGYDIRIKETVTLAPGDFSLASTVERFDMPTDILGLVKNKSSWARVGLNVFETVIEPGWNGFLTIEMVNLSKFTVHIKAGDPIAQVLFFETDEDTVGYSGKYQDQGSFPQEAIFEK